MNKFYVEKPLLPKGVANQLTRAVKKVHEEMTWTITSNHEGTWLKTTLCMHGMCGHYGWEKERLLSKTSNSTQVIDYAVLDAERLVMRYKRQDEPDFEADRG